MSHPDRYEVTLYGGWSWLRLSFVGRVCRYTNALVQTENHATIH